jgi:AhpD family alkylhydroperoxidase
VGTERIQVGEALPEARKHLLQLHKTVEKAAADAGVDARIIELVKIRVSQINGCAFCTDMHSADARKAGESERRLLVLPVWRETELFTEQERAALELAEATARLSEHQEVPDAVYRQATGVFTEEQYVVLAWAATVINAFNRLGVTSRKPLPE